MKNGKHNFFKYGNASKLEAGQQLSWLTSSQLAQEAQVQTNNDTIYESNIYGHLTRAHRDKSNKDSAFIVDSLNFQSPVHSVTSAFTKHTKSFLQKCQQVTKSKMLSGETLYSISSVTFVGGIVAMFWFVMWKYVFEPNPLIRDFFDLDRQPKLQTEAKKLWSPTRTSSKSSNSQLALTDQG